MPWAVSRPTVRTSRLFGRSCARAREVAAASVLCHGDPMAVSKLQARVPSASRRMGSAPGLTARSWRQRHVKQTVPLVLGRFRRLVSLPATGGGVNCKAMRPGMAAGSRSAPSATTGTSPDSSPASARTVLLTGSIASIRDCRNRTRGFWMPPDGWRTWSGAILPNITSSFEKPDTNAALGRSLRSRSLYELLGEAGGELESRGPGAEHARALGRHPRSRPSGSALTDVGRATVAASASVAVSRAWGRSAWRSPATVCFSIAVANASSISSRSS
jgi:hypothetical protein